MRAMSLIHATRVLVIFSLVPFAITLFRGLDLNSPPGKPAADTPFHEIAIMILAGIGGCQIASRIGIPGSSIIGPLILTACCTLAGLINSRPPSEKFLISQFIIGLAVGATYSGIAAAELRKYVVAGVAYTAITRCPERDIDYRCCSHTWPGAAGRVTFVPARRATGDGGYCTRRRIRHRVRGNSPHSADAARHPVCPGLFRMVATALTGGAGALAVSSAPDSAIFRKDVATAEIWMLRAPTEA